MAKPITTYYDENDEPVTLPTVWAICSTCRGDGHHSRHLGAFSGEEFDEAFGTPEEKEDYFAGVYDKTCEDCGGTGKVQIVDRDRLTDEQAERLREEEEAEAEYRAEQAAENRYFYGSDY